jgi:hypothetical protein
VPTLIANAFFLPRHLLEADLKAQASEPAPATQAQQAK